MAGTTEITRLISEWQRGDKAAESALFDALYQKLHAIAVHCIRTEPVAQSLGATGLIHEAYLRLDRSEDLQIADRSHFLALAARVMRRILVDRARARRAIKRDADLQPLSEEIAWFHNTADIDEIISVDRALDVLCTRSPRQGRFVEMRFFGGFSLDESAAALHISTRHARREWDVARLRLREAIDGLKPAE